MVGEVSGDLIEEASGQPFRPLLQDLGILEQ